MTLYLEDMTEGRTFESIGRTVTEADVTNFAGLSGDFAPLHTNEPWVRENTDFDGRIAHGLLVLSISTGLKTPDLDDLVVLAFLDVQRRMMLPTYPGDTIRSRSVVEESRPSNGRPAAGIITLAVEVLNQHDGVVQAGRDVLMVARRVEVASVEDAL